MTQFDFFKYYQGQFLGSAAGTYFSGIAASQFISNVPAAMLLAAFTQQKEALLLGVNIGGLGTLIASMASVISYKLFAEAYPSQVRHYLLLFLYYNAIGLFLLVPSVYFYCCIERIVMRRWIMHVDMDAFFCICRTI